MTQLICKTVPEDVAEILEFSKNFRQDFRDKKWRKDWDYSQKEGPISNVVLTNNQQTYRITPSKIILESMFKISEYINLPYNYAFDRLTGEFYGTVAYLVNYHIQIVGLGGSQIRRSVDLDDRLVKQWCKERRLDRFNWTVEDYLAFQMEFPSYDAFSDHRY